MKSKSSASGEARASRVPAPNTKLSDETLHKVNLIKSSVWRHAGCEADGSSSEEEEEEKRKGQSRVLYSVIALIF